MIGGGGASEQGFLGAIGNVLKTSVYSRFVKQKMGFMMAQPTPADLTLLAGMVESGKLKVVIDRTYKLAEVPEAIRYVEEGHARGKVIITVE
jgi:NADPH:quinone reductase-like Zn-dependent oxidoreductase